MLDVGLYKNLIKAHAYFLIILSLASCKDDQQDTIDEVASLHSAPQIVALDTQEGYRINPVTGDSIQPIINSLGDTVKTGVPVPARGKVIDPNRVAKPQVIPAGKPMVVPIHQNVHKIPEALKVIPVNKDSLKTFTPGVDTSSFVLVNSTGDTLPTGVPIPARGKVVPCRQPQPVKALPPGMKDNASVNMKYLGVDQGMNAALVWSILKDSHGNLWFGTQGGGVSMYNGETFTHFTKKEGLSHNWVKSILEDSHGNLWFGTFGGGVSMYNGDTFTHFTENEGLSHNYINSLLEDSHGNLWFVTARKGVSRYNGETFTHFTVKEGLSRNLVSSLLEDRHGNLWFGTYLGGVSMYNGESFTHITEKDGLSLNGVESILEDRNGNLWFGTTGGGVNMYNGETLTHFTEQEGLSNNWVNSILEDNRGNIWFGTMHGGVSMYDGESFTHITEKEGLSSNWVNSILEDSHGNLWFGTQGGGVSMNIGETVTYFTQKEGLSPYAVMSMLEDSHGNFWFGTWNGGVSLFNGETFTYFTQEEGLMNNIVWSILEDRHGNLWFGTHLGGVSLYNGKTFTHFTQETGLSSFRVYSILEDSHGNLWFGTMNGGVSMYNGQTFTHFTEKEGLSCNQVYSILEDNQGKIWFGTLGGGVSMYDGETFTHFTKKEGLSHNWVVSILEDSHGNLWFGTSGGGVNMFNGETFTLFTQKEGLSDNSVFSILEDSNNNIWVSTNKGLNHLAFGQDVISKRKDSSFTCIPKIYTYDNLGGSSVLVDSKNRIWWGSDKGPTMLDINHLKIPVESPVMHLNLIDIDGQFVDYRHLEDNHRLVKGFSDVARFNNYPLNLELPHNRNQLTFHFSAIDWFAPFRIKYSYKMEGLDDKWSLPNAEADVEYRNMPHGRFTYKVRAIGAAQKWSEPFEYTFRILPPFWLTWWAYMIYGFTILLLIRWYRTFLIKREKIKADLKLKEVEVSKMEELDQMKSRFFANISHEFRTPLTLIQGPIEDLKRDLPDLPVEKSRELLQFMKKNTQRLQHLINQILDISKLETGKVKLQVSEGELEQFVRTLILSFLSLAESKKIKYAYDLPATSDIFFFDSDKVEKILTNLISNAIKFTPEGGKIRVSFEYIPSSIDNTPEFITIKVADTGRGIPREKLEKVFDRFYQVSDSDSRDVEGTGLGLALTKELVDLYHGEISVDSQEGKGSTFTVILPVSKDLFTEEERTTHPTYQETKPEQVEPLREQEELEDIGIETSYIHATAENEPVILIVEDNVDLRNYISRNLEENYRIMTAVNGKAGLDKAVECIPDLIVSDVMMPEMDGMEMSKLLKKDERTNHIPVIMLTAKADRDSKLEGLETGADDYLIKPFDQEELRVRIKNLLEQRKRLREKFRMEFPSASIDMGLPPKDHFLKRLFEIFDQHIEDPEFTINQLSGELNLSLSQVQRKVMAITSYTPSELFRNHRLNNAAGLFRSGHTHVAQVMHRVGFNNQSYFTKCFGELFKMTPSQFITANKK